MLFIERNMKYKWYGTASLLFESNKTRLLFDPYLKKFASAESVPVAEARSAQAIFITHPHFDHFCDIDAFSEGKRDVYVSPSGIKIAQKNKLDASCMHTLCAGDEVRVGAFIVRAYRSRHCVFDAATVARVVLSPRTWCRLPDVVRILREIKRYHIQREDVLAYHVSDGEKSVLLFGSAGMEPTERYPQADLLIFPYQGRSRMDRELLPFLDATSPKAVTIDHFDDAFPPITHAEDTSRFVPTAKMRLPEASAYVPQENVWYQV